METRSGRRIAPGGLTLEQQAGCVDRLVAALGIIEAQQAERADLRAVLAPLLDEPYRDHGCEDCGDGPRCVFCGVQERIGRHWTGRLDAINRKINEDVDTTPHAPDCAVLRRDELLGR